MLDALETRDLACHLFAFENAATKSSDATEPATVRVYEKLRVNLCVLTGAAAFESLASRALSMASARVPDFRAVQVAADGKLQAKGGMKWPMGTDENWNEQKGVILISSLLDLLFMFLGKTLTMNLVLNVWPDKAFDNDSPQTGEKREHPKQGEDQ